MIAGCYQLHLYCDNKVKHPYKEFPHEYTAEFGSQCRKEARADGWTIRKGKAICPLCNAHNGDEPR